MALVCEQAQEHGTMLYAALKYAAAGLSRPSESSFQLRVNHCSLLCSWCSGREQQSQPEASDSEGEGAAPGPGSWEKHPELAAAVVVHHETILRLKRILLAYTCASAAMLWPLGAAAPAERAAWLPQGCCARWCCVRSSNSPLRRRERRNRVKQLRWQQRSLPDCVAPNLSLAEKEVRNIMGLSGPSAAADARSGLACLELVQHSKAPLILILCYKCAVVPEVRPAAERLHAHGRPGPHAGAFSVSCSRGTAVMRSVHRPRMKQGPGKPRC